MLKKLTSSSSGKFVYVNSTAITFVKAERDGTKIYFIARSPGDYWIIVKESPEEVAKILNETTEWIVYPRLL